MVGRFLRAHTNPPVFVISLLVLVGFVLVGVITPGGMETVATAIQGFIVDTFGWLYILGVSALLVFVIIIALSRFGKIKLGDEDSVPEFSNWAWFAMLFTAGMGIGLVFFGVAEPLFHFQDPPVGEGGNAAAAQEAMNLTFFHWGLHPWAVYIVLGLALGYAAFRRGLPLRPASIFYPLLGDRTFGPIGNAIDILAVFGTIFGLGTSLGLGAQQIDAGLNTVFGIPSGTTTQVVLIGIITAVALVSVLLGIHGGIRRLALTNLWLAIILAGVVLLAGPTLYIVNSLASNIGYYLQSLPQTSLQMYTYTEGGNEFLSGWTLFYWAWWISWSPFVGMFIARISYGRSVRQFIWAMLLAPVGASAVWFTIFGNTALQSLLAGQGGALTEASTETAMFVLLEQVFDSGAIATLLSLLAIIVVALFFVTSSDSGSLVVDILTNGGDPNPMWQTRAMWAILEGAIAAVLLIVGGLTALQTASLIAGLPFSIVLLLMAVALIKAMSQDPLIVSERWASSTPSPGEAATRPAAPSSGVSPQQVQRMSAEDPTERRNRSR